MEELRAVAVDAVVLALWRQGSVNVTDFEIADEPGPGDTTAPMCRLRGEPRRRCVEAFEARLNSPFTHPRLGVVMDLRRAMQAQVAHYREVLMRREPAYLPLKFR
jgi:CRISPR/Cas system-associated endonuclease Cas1